MPIIRRKWFFCTVLGAAVLSLTSAPASAEWAVDLFGGGAFTQNQNINVKLSGIKLDFKDIAFRNSYSIGGRIGYWLESVPYLGMALDASHFHADIDGQTVVVCSGGPCAPSIPVAHLDFAITGISLDAMLRLPLWTSKEFPQGRLQPYLTVGPTIFIGRAEGPIDSAQIPVHSRSDTDTAIGFQSSAGFAWQFHPHWALFAEYRFTRFDSGFNFPVLGSKATEQRDVKTYRALFGISYRFH